MDAIEIDENAYHQSFENIRNSPFKHRVFPELIALQDFKPTNSYDLIVSHPPYFSNSTKSPNSQRNEARHNDGLSLKILINKSLQMICDAGRIALILPVENSKHLDLQIASHNLQILRRTDVITVEGQEPKRFMIELAHYNTGKPVFNTLILETRAHKRTPEYQELTENFYLN
jgi:tRNA1Val (adenine37-N6)-methyltransferase